MYVTTTTRNAPVFGLRREIDRLFEDAFGYGPAERTEWAPAVDISENDQELTFAVEVPGLKPEEVEVTAVDGVLTIQGERIDGRKVNDDGRYYLVERNYGSFLRRFQLPQGLDSEKILADVENGVLQVHVPKMALSKAKKIQITAGADVSRGTKHAIGSGETHPTSKTTVGSVAAK